ncbi:signal transduction histidine kinase [Catenuloplanes atrovinosus]|uniref:histidine kinase n=2 Tax=Catenuloplanes atrovinosus TaxID=137266 RepID=A0AAE4C939_9ACTN|nr:signal transduction histidine kinase [Catenuloplanes atrovinosus]
MPGTAARYPADIALAVAVWFVDVALFSDAAVTLAGRAPIGAPAHVIAGYAALGCLPLVWRRAAPALVYALVWLVTTGALFVPGYQAIMPLVVALFTVSARLPSRYATPALLLVVVPLGGGIAQEVTAAAPADQVGVLLAGMLVYGIAYGTAWAVGHWSYRSRRRAVLAERQRLAAAREAVAAERLRVARELHDIISHAVTVMVLQAGGAHRLLRRDPDRAEEALAHVRDAGAQAMNELRRMLVVLRRTQPAEEETTPGPVTEPVDADRLEELLAGMRRAGLPVRLETWGEPRPVDPSIALTAFRVVQEALTNVSRHAGLGADTTVRLDWSHNLRIQVRNGPGSAPPDGHAGTGHGLVGLRERVEVAGGDLIAGRTAEGGFEVVAMLPTPAA